MSAQSHHPALNTFQFTAIVQSTVPATVRGTVYSNKKWWYSVQLPSRIKFSAPVQFLFHNTFRPKATIQGPAQSLVQYQTTIQDFHPVKISTRPIRRRASYWQIGSKKCYQWMEVKLVILVLLIEKDKLITPRKWPSCDADQSSKRFPAMNYRANQAPCNWSWTSMA